MPQTKWKATLLRAITRHVLRDFAPGDVCSVISSEGYKIVKILAVERRGVHVMLYKDLFPRRPKSVDVKSLTLGSMLDRDELSIGHLPLSRNTFRSWAPIRIGRGSVTTDELTGYRAWESESGGFF